MDRSINLSGSSPIQREDPILHINRIATPDILMINSISSLPSSTPSSRASSPTTSSNSNNATNLPAPTTTPPPLQRQTSASPNSISSSAGNYRTPDRVLTSSLTHSSEKERLDQSSSPQSVSATGIGSTSSSSSSSTNNNSNTLNKNFESLSISRRNSNLLAHGSLSNRVNTPSPKSNHTLEPSAISATNLDQLERNTDPALASSSGHRRISQRSTQPFSSISSPFSKTTSYSNSSSSTTTHNNSNSNSNNNNTNTFISSEIIPVETAAGHSRNHTRAHSYSYSLGNNISSTRSALTGSNLTTKDTLKSQQSSTSNSRSTKGKLDTKQVSLDDSSHLALHDFLYHRGFLQGEGSDVTICCFNKTYKLHRLILCRSPYFASLFSSYWDTTLYSSKSSSPTASIPENKIHNLSLDQDENITQRAFELAISRLYGHEDPEEERHNVLGLFAVANFLDLPSLVDFCVEEIIGKINPQTVSQILQFSYKYNYGEASKQIVDSCKNFLYSEGYEMKLECWHNIPNSIIAEVVGSDAFFVPTEWDRCQFLVEIYNWRVNTLLNQNGGTLTAADREELQPLRYTLDHEIHYCNMTYDQLELLEGLRDQYNQPIISRHILRESLWLQTGLRQKILRSNNSDEKLGLVNEVPEDKLSKFLEQELDDYSDGRCSPSGSSPTITKDKKYDHSNSEVESEQGGFVIFGDDDDSTTYYPVPATDETLDTPWERKNRKFTSVTKYPPFRFSVKFDDVTMLQNDKRVYSNTYWYAGNFWNVYIQKAAYRRGHQLGVYIHRGKIDMDALNHSSGSLINAAHASAIFRASSTVTGTDSLRRPAAGGSSNSFPANPFNNNAPFRRGYELDHTVRTSSPFGREPTPTNATISTGFAPIDVMDDNNDDGTVISPIVSTGLGQLLFPVNGAGNDQESNDAIQQDVVNENTTNFDAAAIRPTSPFAFNNGGGMETGNGGGSTHRAHNLAQDNNSLLADVLNAIDSDTNVSSSINPNRSRSNNSGNESPSNTLVSPAGTLIAGSNSSSSKPQQQQPVAAADYIDSRKKISAYFEIYTPSRKGRSSLTCFSSSPDVFNFSQSWGWKSSSLYVKADELKKGGNNGGLKFMVSVGLV